MQMSHQAILCIIAIFNNSLTLVNSASLTRQNAVELKSCGAVNVVAFREDLLPIILCYVRRVFLLNLMALAPILELGSTVVSPEQGLRELVESLRDSLQGGD